MNIGNTKQVVPKVSATYLSPCNIHLPTSTCTSPLVATKTYVIRLNCTLTTKNGDYRPEQLATFSVKLVWCL